MAKSKKIIRKKKEENKNIIFRFSKWRNINNIYIYIYIIVIFWSILFQNIYGFILTRFCTLIHCINCRNYLLTAWVTQHEKRTLSVLSSCLSSNQSICSIQKFISITLAKGLTLYFRFALYKKHQKCEEKVQAKGSLLEKHAKILDHLLLLGNFQNKSLGSPQSSTKEHNKKRKSRNPGLS